jgi:hypothetical protein
LNRLSIVCGDAGGGMNDEPVVFFQPGNPVLNVSGRVAVRLLAGDASDSEEKGRAHIGYQFLLALKLISEASAEGTIEAAFMAGAVD